MNTFRLVKKILPQTLLSVARALRGDLNFNGRRSKCPFCLGGQFLWVGKPPALSLECKLCGSSSRERIIFWAIEHESIGLSEPILHFAAEKNLERFLRKKFTKYRTADKYLKSDCIIDIENIELESNSETTVIASHVLDMTDLTASLSELTRILDDSGKAILLIEQSDFSLTTKKIGSKEQWESATLRNFDGQKMIAGIDFRKILEGHFNHVREIRPLKDIAISMGIFPIETLFVASK